MDNLVYTGADHKDNWFYNKYYNNGTNCRYFTFQAALNLMHQRFNNPLIVETGCQRQEDDFGAGMSTSIFAEYINRYGGNLWVVDNNATHLNRAKTYVGKYPSDNVKYFLSDSVTFLETVKDNISLLYLDSYDYPIVEMWRTMDPHNTDHGRELVEAMSRDELFQRFGKWIEPCQEHCLKEFQAIEYSLNDDVILLIDDNNYPGGGKPGTLKPYLEEDGWVCVLDNQQTLWIRE